MKIIAKYSHLNGLEWLNHHHSNMWDEIEGAIEAIDAYACKTKISKEKTMLGRTLFSPTAMNVQFKLELESRGWLDPVRYEFVLTDDAELTSTMINEKMTYEQQKVFLRDNGKDVHGGYTQSDFFKNRVSIEVQFGKYAFVQYDIFVKHAADYMHNRIDLGIEIVPMKSLENEMSSGPSNYERNLHELLRQGRIFPPVPLVLIGIAP